MRHAVFFLLDIVLGEAPTQFVVGDDGNTLILAGTLSLSSSSSGSDEQQSRSLECLQGFDLVSSLSQSTPYHNDLLGIDFTVEFNISDDGGDEATVSEFYADPIEDFHFLLGPHGTSLSRVAAAAAEYPMMLHSAPNSGIFSTTYTSSIFSLDARHEWMEKAVAWFAEQGASSIMAVMDDSDVANEKCVGVLKVAETYGLVNMGVHTVSTIRDIINTTRHMGTEDPDIVVTCLSLVSTYKFRLESRYLTFEPKGAWIADKNLTTGVDTFGIHFHRVVGAADINSIVTDCWRDGDLALFQEQFLDLHGTEASDTALRCATAAHTIATVVAGDSENNVRPGRIASLLSGLDEVTTCYGTLTLNGTHVKADDLVMQLVISETIEDARVVRHWTEAELTYPALGWDELDAEV